VHRIEQIDDLETAREVAKLLEKENARLQARLEALVRENAALRGDSGTKQFEIEIVRLQEQMAALQRKVFAASSEKQRKAKATPMVGAQGSAANRPCVLES
jgi:transposase